MNCRLGIIADALYCPVTDSRKSAVSGEVTTSSTAITSTTEFAPNRPTLIELVLSNIPRPESILSNIPFFN